MLCCSPLIGFCSSRPRLPRSVSHPSSSSHVRIRQIILLKPIECQSCRRVEHRELQRFDATHFSTALNLSVSTVCNLRIPDAVISCTHSTRTSRCLIRPTPKRLAIPLRRSRDTEGTQRNFVFTAFQHHYERQSQGYSRCQAVVPRPHHCQE